MKVNDNHLDMIFDYIGNKSYLFYSDSMTGKTNAQLDYLIKYLYNNDYNVVVLSQNINTIHKISPIIDKYNNPFKYVAYHFADNNIRFGNSNINIVHNEINLYKELKNNNYDIILIDNLNNSITHTDENLSEFFNYLIASKYKLIINCSITRNKKILNTLNRLKKCFHPIEINTENLFFLERVSKINKIKKRVE